MRHLLPLRPLVGAAALAALSGCASAPAGAPPPAPAAPALDPAAARLAAADEAFRERDRPERLAEAIAAWREELGRKDALPLRLRLSRAENLRAQLAAAPQARREAYARWAEEARRALALAGGDPARACEAGSREVVPALYWLAENLEGLAREAGLVAGAAPRNEALCLARRAATLDPAYFHAGPLRLLGRLLAAAPALAGGDAAASRAAFERAIATAPEFLGNRVDFAATCLVKLQDAPAFEAALGAALSAEPKAPELDPENRLARERARALRAARPGLF